MVLPTFDLTEQSRRIGLLIMYANGEVALCPFFGKCDGLLLIDPDTGAREFLANTQRTAEAMCDLILETGTHRLVLGFIGESAAQKLRSADVDVRLGCCARPVEDLAIGFDSLPVP